MEIAIGNSARKGIMRKTYGTALSTPARLADGFGLKSNPTPNWRFTP